MTLTRSKRIADAYKNPRGNTVCNGIVGFKGRVFRVRFLKAKISAELMELMQIRNAKGFMRCIDAVR